MNYIENIFVCLIAPLIIAVIGVKGRAKRMLLFLIIGMGTCLLSSYISTYIASVNGVDMLIASLEYSPFVEEVMKLFPVMCYLLIFEPKAQDAADSALMTAIGFATFENVCFLTANGAYSTVHLLIRGFGTGAAHVVCALFIAICIYRLWEKEWLRAPGIIALLSVAITYHGVFNILVSQTGVAAYIGYSIPLITVFVTWIFRKKLFEA